MDYLIINLFSLYDDNLKNINYVNKTFDERIFISNYIVYNASKTKSNDINKNLNINSDILKELLEEQDEKINKPDFFTIMRTKEKSPEQLNFPNFNQKFAKKPQNNHIDFANLSSKPFNNSFKAINFNEDSPKSEKLDEFNKISSINKVKLPKLSSDWLENLIKIDDKDYKQNIKTEILNYLSKKDRVRIKYLRKNKIKNLNK